ncbi:hypothetical protein ARHIZOSPH14_27360 [Agromyces rhizosphaerae]|uniref:Uncharacterized protein n=1 Tax=Agromyces rhizosphaerae TaxID=88374 RepID=A0A9W6D082_9MICO|nr:hypothetical protein [Agromyces rhizosphaerae]GLI28494.1 hypothetical protein ARHIZOSPH14_27360 [Agromyces rhizosphaerae]
MTIAIDSFYGTQQPYAVSTNEPEAHWTDTVVAQGHADYCSAYGHSAFVAAATGKQSERCGRCGDLLGDTESAPVKDAGEDTPARPATVLINISDNEGYSPEQINTHITLGAMLESIQEAIDEFGEDAKVVLSNGQRYGAGFGSFVGGYGDSLEVTNAEDGDTCAYCEATPGDNDHCTWDGTPHSWHDCGDVFGGDSNCPTAVEAIA